MRNPELNLKTKLEIFISNCNIDCNSVLWIDLFCGAGGTSTGIHLSKNNHHVLACVNHDQNAIKSHLENHPHSFHFTEDIRDFEVVRKLTLIVNEIRKIIPGIKINLWASLECTNFSKAKGGLPRDADSRTLAEHMNMYIEALNVDYFYVENVREFMAWGPLDKNGKPISRKNGQDFMRWKKEIENFYYKSQYKILNSADFGSYQSRERLFMIFAKNGNPFFWPEQTHAKNGSDNDLFGIKKHKAVREILDLEDKGVSIFERKKPLAENTLKRIYAGLEKFVANGDNVFTKRYNGGSVGTEYKSNSLNKPMGTILSNNTHALVFVSNYKSGHPSSKNHSIDLPIGTVSTIPTQSVVSLQTYYGNGGIHTIDTAAPTVTTKDRIAKVDVSFIDQQYSNSKPIGINQPCNTLTINPKFALINAKHFLYNPQYSSKGKSIDEPCFTLIARQDKAPASIVSIENGFVNICVYDDDSETMKAIKRFMVDHQIVDIKMRMLKIPELLQIQGFPKDYKLVGTQTEQKKYIGNAVEVNMAKALISAIELS
ncbi:DNA cytosine methyltransferase [Empedobacter brevis]|uniref:DNA cytosine methyltransferase n=1 Tax=Empedobacter brevis TaxID=247 RepID=UPI00289689BB|nr:DNA cytosine methyltransferase [Empedobacter brevis]